MVCGMVYGTNNNDNNNNNNNNITSFPCKDDDWLELEAFSCSHSFVNSGGGKHIGMETVDSIPLYFSLLPPSTGYFPSQVPRPLFHGPHSHYHRNETWSSAAAGPVSSRTWLAPLWTKTLASGSARVVVERWGEDGVGESEGGVRQLDNHTNFNLVSHSHLALPRPFGGSGCR